MAHSNFSIQSRPTQYLFFPTTDGKLIRVTSNGLAAESNPEELEYMRWADFSSLMDNMQFVAALSVARSYASNAGLQLEEETVHFD